MERILVINPGSTSTKIAVYEDETPLFVKTINHSKEELAPFKEPFDQYEYRRDLVLRTMEENGVTRDTLTAVVSRGGLLPPVRSGAYERTLRALDPAVTVIQKACPLFVPLAEEGRTRPGDPVIETVAEEYLASLRQEGIDTLILGCTHYPLLKDVIANVMGPGVALIDSGEESAKELQRLLTASDSLGEPQGGGAIYCVSDRVEDFQRLASRFLGEDVAGAARRVEVEDV